MCIVNSIGAPKFLSQPQDSIVNQDASARFECLIDALPKPKVSWLLNGKELTNKDNVKFEVDQKTSANCLVIPKVLTSHGGTLTVKASNTVGEAEYSFKLEVFGIF
jgi:hypothetical protein